MSICARLYVEAFLEHVEPGAQPPPAQRLIGRAELDAVRLTLEIVREEQRNDRGRREAHAAQIAVVIIECRDRGRDPGAKLRAVSQLVGDQDLRLEIAAARENYREL